MYNPKWYELCNIKQYKNDAHDVLYTLFKRHCIILIDKNDATCCKQYKNDAHKT